MTSFSLFTFMHCRRKWQPSPVFLPGESQGQERLVGCCLWGHTESDMTKVTQQQQKRKWQPIPVFLFGESQGQRSLMGCCLWGRTESDMTKVTQQQQRRKWQPTPVFLPEESQGWGSLVGCHLWGHRVRHDRSDLAAAFKDNSSQSSSYCPFRNSSMEYPLFLYL